jgi:hypothetical protein
LASIASEFFFVGVPNGHVLVGDPHFQRRVWRCLRCRRSHRVYRRRLSSSLRC